MNGICHKLCHIPMASLNFEANKVEIKLTIFNVFICLCAFDCVHRFNSFRLKCIKFCRLCTYTHTHIGSHITHRLTQALKSIALCVCTWMYMYFVYLHILPFFVVVFSQSHLFKPSFFIVLIDRPLFRSSFVQ